MFHHYSVVSVEGKEANVAIIQPGKIFPSTISTREYGELISASLPQLNQRYLRQIKMAKPTEN